MDSCCHLKKVKPRSCHGDCDDAGAEWWRYSRKSSARQHASSISSGSLRSVGARILSHMDFLTVHLPVMTALGLCGAKCEKLSGRDGIDVGGHWMKIATFESSLDADLKTRYSSRTRHSTRSFDTACKQPFYTNNTGSIFPPLPLTASPSITPCK